SGIGLAAGRWAVGGSGSSVGGVTMSEAPSPEQPLSTMLSHVLIAFTIEFDNEAEHRMTHRTTLARQSGEELRGPWLGALPMWANFLRFVAEDGVPLADLTALARITNLAGIERWGYLTINEEVVCLSRGGRHAAGVWRPLAAEIEARWRERFGAARIAGL